MIFSFATIDRINLGSAYAAGMGRDLVRWRASYKLISNWHNRDIGSSTRRSFQFGCLHILRSIYTLVSLLDSSLSCSWLTPATRQLPGNLLLRKFGVRNWLAFIVISYGAVQLGMGFINVWPWLVFCRILLGALEVWQLLPVPSSVIHLINSRHRSCLQYCLWWRLGAATDAFHYL